MERKGKREREKGENLANLKIFLLLLLLVVVIYIVYFFLDFLLFFFFMNTVENFLTPYYIIYMYIVCVSYHFINNSSKHTSHILN